MPVMNRRGDVLMAGTSLNGAAPFAPAPCEHACWFTDDVAVYHQGPNWHLDFYDLTTGTTLEADTRGETTLVARNGRWAAKLQGEIRTSWGLVLRNAGSLLAIGDDGTLVVADPAGTPTRLVNPDGSTAILSNGSCLFVAHERRGRTLWKDYAGQLHADGVTLPILQGRPHALFRINGRDWILQGLLGETALVLHPLDSTHGYLVASSNNLYRPCAAVLGNTVKVAWSFGAGELRNDQRGRLIDLSAPTIDLSTIVASPGPSSDPSPDPTPIAALPPLWVFPFKVIGRGGDDAAEAIPRRYNAAFVGWWREFDVTQPNAIATWRSHLASVRATGAAIVLGDDALLEPALTPDIVAFWPDVAFVYVTTEQNADPTDVAAVERQLAIVDARCRALGLSPRPYAAYMDVDDLTAFPWRWPNGADWFVTRNYLGVKAPADWVSAQTGLIGQLSRNLALIRKRMPTGGKIVIACRAYRGNGDTWGSAECVEAIQPIYAEAARSIAGDVIGLGFFAWNRAPFTAARDLPKVGAWHQHIYNATTAPIISAPPVDPPVDPPDEPPVDPPGDEGEGHDMAKFLRFGTMPENYIRDICARLEDDFEQQDPGRKAVADQIGAQFGWREIGLDYQSLAHVAANGLSYAHQLAQAEMNRTGSAPGDWTAIAQQAGDYEIQKYRVDHGQPQRDDLPHFPENYPDPLTALS